MKRILEYLAVLGIVAILAAILSPVFTQTKNGKRNPCLIKIKRLATALMHVLWLSVCESSYSTYVPLTESAKR